LHDGARAHRRAALAPRRAELLPRRHPGGRAPHSGRLDQPQGRAPDRRRPSGPGVPDADRARRLADGDTLPLARVLLPWPACSAEPPTRANAWSTSPGEIARPVPGAQLAIFEQSGHSPQIEERSAFTKRLAAFLGA